MRTKVMKRAGERRTAITLLTALSVAEIATDRVVRVGGAYYMISRSLGAPAGAAIGIPLYIGQALSTTIYIVGFTEALGILVPAAEPRLVGTAVLPKRGDAHAPAAGGSREA